MAIETGHHKNNDNYNRLIQYAVGYGAQYNPVPDLIKIPQMTAQHTAAADAIAAVLTRKTPFNNAVNDRMAAFEGFLPFVTKVINAFAASDVPTGAIADARAIVRKIRGVRTPKPKDDPETPQDESLDFISASQISYDSRIQHFHDLVILITAQPGYNPNEAPLTPAALNTYLTGLRTVNAAVATAIVPYSNAIISRNNILYHPATGVIEASKRCKAYIKSVFGASSQQYAQVSGIEFRTLVRIVP